MPNPLMECVANFSEGRRAPVIDAIAAAIVESGGIALLGKESDRDHNRAVISFAGQPAAMIEAAYTAIAVAARQIDMTRHSGQHPRIGAADVIPFVPLRDMTMNQAVDMAHSLGRRVGDELDLPVFMYANAALESSKRELSSIRRGGYERLCGAISSGDGPQPDYGPRRMGMAGACAIAARETLIAFNVYLESADQDIAQAIARAVRASSGGLPHVKALGLLVNGKAQVSMNLTDYRVTPIHVALSAVEREARRRGLALANTELIGLLPRAALKGSRDCIDNFTPERVLEDQLAKWF